MWLKQGVPTFEEILRWEQFVTQKEVARYFGEVLRSWQWWLLLALLIVPWILFVKFVDRSRLPRILLVGFFAFFFALLFDEIGTETQLWAYQFRTTPFLHVLIPYDFTVVPVVFMLLYQYFHTWKSYFYAHVVNATLFAFVSEPLLIWMNIYEPIHWRNYYSFPIYILIGLLVRWVVHEKIYGPYRT